MRAKPTSCRPLKLTEEQQVELRTWFYSARTVAKKARELRISRAALYNYVNYRHKPRKDDDLTLQTVEFHGEQIES